MNNKKADMVFTDPPYGVNYEGKTKEKLKIKNDINTNIFKDSILGIIQSLKSGGTIYVCCPAGNNFKDFFKTILILVAQTSNCCNPRKVLYVSYFAAKLRGKKRGTVLWIVDYRPADFNFFSVRVVVNYKAGKIRVGKAFNRDVKYCKELCAAVLYHCPSFIIKVHAFWRMYHNWKIA